MTGVGCGGFASPLGLEDEEDDDEEEALALSAELELEPDGLELELEPDGLEELDGLAGSDGMVVKKKGVV